MHLRRMLPALALFPLVALACQDVATVDPADLQLLVVSGDAQEGSPFTELPEPLVVKVVNPKSGAGQPNQVVNFRVVEGGGSVFAGVATTDPQGIAKEYWTLGAPGPQQLEARAVSSRGEKLVYGTFTATATAPGPVVFYDQAEFTAASGAVLTVIYPNLKPGDGIPYSENGVTMESATGLGFANGVQQYTPVLPGYEFGVSGAENINIAFATPVTAFGIWMQDGFAIGTVGSCPPFGPQDSQFTFTFKAGSTVILTLTEDPPIDQAFFLGVMLGQAAYRLEIREVGSVVSDFGDKYCENDFFGHIYLK